jgi:hypothetical protein
LVDAWGDGAASGWQSSTRVRVTVYPRSMLELTSYAGGVDAAREFLEGWGGAGRAVEVIAAEKVLVGDAEGFRATWIPSSDSALDASTMSGLVIIAGDFIYYAEATAPTYQWEQNAPLFKAFLDSFTLSTPSRGTISNGLVLSQGTVQSSDIRAEDFFDHTHTPGFVPGLHRSDPQVHMTGTVAEVQLVQNAANLRGATEYPVELDILLAQSGLEYIVTLAVLSDWESVDDLELIAAQVKGKRIRFLANFVGSKSDPEYHSDPHNLSLPFDESSYSSIGGRLYGKYFTIPQFMEQVAIIE